MKLLWDFFGPDAERTAVHFEKHLIQFLTNNGHPELTRGTESAGAGHHAAFCIVPEVLLDPMKRALRPNRMVPDVPAAESSAAESSAAESSAAESSAAESSAVES